MSDQAEPQGQNPEQGNGGNEPQINVSELQARMERLESSNSRLLEESKAWKNKYQNVKSEAEERETLAMQESNDFKGLYEKAQNELAEMKQAQAEVKRDNLKSSLRYEVAKGAKDSLDVDMLVNYVAGSEFIAYDQEAKQWKGIDDAIGAARKEKSFLFDRERVGMANGRPSDQPPKEKSARERLADDPKAVLNELLQTYVK